MPRYFTWNVSGVSARPYPVLHSEGDFGPEHKKLIRQKHEISDLEEAILRGKTVQEQITYLKGRFPYNDPDPEVKPDVKPADVASSADQSNQVAELSAT